MSHPEELKRLNAEITTHMNHLSKTMRYVLALYVLGMVIMRHCGQSQIATFLGGLLGQKPNTVRQRLRELTYEAPRKRGDKRQALDVQGCFAPLLSWVLAKFRGDQRQLVLALDATYLGERFVILAVSVVVAGCAIPVAWHIQKGDAKGKWNPIWKQLLKQIQPAVPTSWQVFVLTDSGLYSKTLFKAITKTHKWHVMMRISGGQGIFKAKGARQGHRIQTYLYRGMKPLVLEGVCFSSNPLTCILIMQWEAAYDQPCLIVTNLPPHAIQSQIYGIRYWIECGFKDVKRGLFHWEQTKMTDPKRAERLWLVISIALLWLTAVGDSQMPTLHGQRTGTPKRRLSAPVQGWITLILSLLRGEPLPYGHLNPYPWDPIPETQNTYP